VEAITVSWSCAKCERQGGMNLLPTSTESEPETGARHQRWTRAYCVPDCLFRIPAAPGCTFKLHTID